MLSKLLPKLKPGARFIEPFLGSGAVFLNTHYPRYLLADTNPDLIGLYQQLLNEGERFICYCQRFFTPQYNAQDKFYELRDSFNQTHNRRRKSALFLYLNRHGYNGLCRYNSRGKFNTPFGRYEKPYFPIKEMQQFRQQAKQAEFLSANFDMTMARAVKGDVIYCDPPYIPLSDTAYFTDYHVGGFNWDDQMLLTETARQMADRGVQVLISNHDTTAVRKLYKDADAKLSYFKVQRNISSNGSNREKVGELLAVF